MILLVLNCTHGLDLFLMLETGPWVQNFHGRGKIRVRCPLCSHLFPRLVEVTSPPLGQQKRRVTHHCSSIPPVLLE